jgi:hypothetical protein
MKTTINYHLFKFCYYKDTSESFYSDIFSIYSYYSWMNQFVISNFLCLIVNEKYLKQKFVLREIYKWIKLVTI